MRVELLGWSVKKGGKEKVAGKTKGAAGIAVAGFVMANWKRIAVYAAKCI